MNLEDFLRQTESQFKRAGIATSRLDALVFIENELGRDRAWIFAHLDEPIPKLNKKFIQSLQRRVNHEPLAYILGKSEFYGREFAVNNHTLVPRPETETMIDLAKKHIKNLAHVVDVGCGSGAIGLTTLLEKIGTKLTMIDIDKECLDVSEKNSKKYEIPATVLKSNLLESFQAPAEPVAIMANLPYVPDAHTINEAAMHEPKHAIFGGTDGLDLYRRMFGQAKRLRTKPTLIFTESLPPQHKKLVQIASQAGYKLVDEQDFIQVFTKN